MSDPDHIPGHRFSTTVVLAAAAVVAALIAMFAEPEAFGPLTVGAALLGLVPWAVVAGGVRVPVPLFAAITLSLAIVIVVADRNPGGMFPAMLAVIWVCRETSHRASVILSVLAPCGAIITLAVLKGTTHETGMLYFLGGIGTSTLAGVMLRRQEALTDELRALDELRVEHAAVAERTRIAREVHDVVAHSLTVTMLHLTGARRALATDPARAAEALERAESVGRDSLDSIRQVVGLLRDADPASLSPLPGARGLSALLDDYRVGGLVVAATVELPDDALDATRQLGLYRVVQESLTNVSRHAPGAACEVRVRLTETGRGRGVVRIEVENGLVASSAAAATRAGLGLRGMAERVHALGGSFDAGPTPSGGWLVRATIPAIRASPGSPTGERAPEQAAPAWPATR
jgi:signal transduction histidine kinase